MHRPERGNAVRPEAHHGIGEGTSEKNVDQSGETPVAHASNPRVIVALRTVDITRPYDQVVPFGYFVDQFGDAGGVAVAVGHELDNHVADRYFHDFPHRGTIAAAPLPQHPKIVSLAPLDGAVSRTSIDNDDLVYPVAVDLRHNDLNSFDFV